MNIHKNKWVWIIAGILLLSAAIILFRKEFTAVDVRAEPATRQSLTITVTATSTGTIKADKEAKVAAGRAGRITKLLFDEGDTVKAGEVVAELDGEETYYNLKIAEAAFQKAGFMLNQLKASFDSFKIEVEKNIDKAKATMAEAESRRKRYTELGEKGYISAMDVDTVQKEYSLAAASLSSALASQEQVKAKADEIKAQEAALKETGSRLSLAKINHEYSFVRAPISGVLTSRPVRLGEGVLNNGVLAAIVSPESMYIEAFIDEADVAKVKTGQKVHISMDAYPGKVFTGEAYRISPVVLGTKQETRTFEVRVRLKENHAVIKPGMSADIEVIVDSIEKALIVPSQAVIEKDNKRLVYVITGSKARLAPVETGRFNWNFIEVKTGIKEGDLIIANTDAAGLRDGARVRRK